ncbi:uncharacterized protein LOC142343923 isoform X2 [Convolutriloba macropyga]
MMKMLVSTMTSFSEQITHLQSEVEEYKTVLDCSTRAAELRYESLAEKHKMLKKEVKELKTENSTGICPCYQRRVSSSLQMDGLNKRIKEKFVGINAMQLTHSKLTNPLVIDELLRKRLIPLLFLLNNKFQQGIEYFLHPCRPPATGQKTMNSVISPSSAKTGGKNPPTPIPPVPGQVNPSISENVSIDNMSTITSVCSAPVMSTLKAIESNLLAKESTRCSTSSMLNSNSLQAGNDHSASTVLNTQIDQSDHALKSVLFGKQRPILPKGITAESKSLSNSTSSSVNNPPEPHFLLRDVTVNRDSIRSHNMELQTQMMNSGHQMAKPTSTEGAIMVSLKSIRGNHGKVFPSYTARKTPEPNILKRSSDLSSGISSCSIEAKRQKSNQIVPRSQIEPTQSAVTLNTLVKSALSKLSAGQQNQTKQAAVQNVIPSVVSVKKPTPMLDKSSVPVKEEPIECNEASALIPRPPLRSDLSNENNRIQASNISSKIKVVKSCSLASGNLGKRTSDGAESQSRVSVSNSEITVKEEPLDPEGTSLNCNEILETSNPVRGDKTNSRIEQSNARDSETVLNNSTNSDDISPFLMQF